MTYSLFIDDERDPIDVTWSEWSGSINNWIIARNQDEVGKIINSMGFPSVVSFDHDLGENIPTGYDICQLMVNKDISGDWQIPEDFEFYIHSKNPVGGENIQKLMNRYLDFRRGL